MSYRARWLTSEPEEKTLFNTFIAGHPEGHAMQLWEWGDIKGRTGWRPWRLILEEHGAVVAAATVLERPLPIFKAPLFYAPRGPVADLRQEALLKALWEAVAQKARERRAILFKIDPEVPAGDRELEDLLRTAGFRLLATGPNFEGIQPRYVFRLDIRPDAQTLLANMHQKTRYNIRLAAKKGVVVRTGTRDDLSVFYRVLQETTERDNFLVRSLTYFEDLYDTLVPAGYAELFIGEYAGVVVAGALAFTVGDKAWYVYGASSNAHRNVMPNYLIQWTMIQWAQSRGCTLYDFRGVSGDLNENNPLYGLYKFKKGFNGEFTEFIGEWDLVYRPVLYKLWQAAEKLYSGRLKALLAKWKRREP